MLIASRLHFTPPPPLIACTLCAWRERDWGEGITTTTDDRRPFRFTCLSAVYHGLHFSLYPLPSPYSAVDDRFAQFRWLSCGRRRLLINGQQYRIGCHGRKKYRPIPILPNTCKYCPIPDNPIPASFEPYMTVISFCLSVMCWFVSK